AFGGAGTWVAAGLTKVWVEGRRVSQGGLSSMTVAATAVASDRPACSGLLAGCVSWTGAGSGVKAVSGAGTGADVDGGLVTGATGAGESDIRSFFRAVAMAKDLP